MYGLRGKKEKRKKVPRYSGELGEKIRRIAERRARSAALWLNKKTATLSPKQLRMILAVWGICWGAACVSVAAHSFWGAGPRLRIQSITTPGPLHPAARAGPSRDARLPVVRERITRFQEYLDSLRSHDPTRYEQILASRPGLLDSLHQVETEYFMSKISK